MSKKFLERILIRLILYNFRTSEHDSSPKWVPKVDIFGRCDVTGFYSRVPGLSNNTILQEVLGGHSTTQPSDQVSAGAEAFKPIFHTRYLNTQIVRHIALPYLADKLYVSD